MFNSTLSIMHFICSMFESTLSMMHLICLMFESMLSMRHFIYSMFESMLSMRHLICSMFESMLSMFYCIMLILLNYKGILNMWMDLYAFLSCKKWGADFHVMMLVGVEYNINSICIVVQKITQNRHGTKVQSI